MGDESLMPMELELHERERKGKQVSCATSFAAGCVSGIASIVCGAPFDIVKVRLQTGSYAGPMDCLKQLVAREGPGALFKGTASPVLTASFINGIVFFSYNEAQKAMLKGTSREKLTYGEICVAGGLAGAVQCSVLCPTELVKCQLQVQTSNTTYSGPMHVLRQTLRGRGLIGLYQGLGPTLLRDVPAFAVYFSLYEIVKDKLESRGNPTWAASFAAGGAAGAASWGAVYPIDVVKSVMQTRPAGTSQSLIGTTRALLSQHGPSFFFRGLSVALIRALPVNGVVFPVYETTVRTLQNFEEPEHAGRFRATPIVE